MCEGFGGAPGTGVHRLKPVKRIGTKAPVRSPVAPAGPYASARPPPPLRPVMFEPPCINGGTGTRSASLRGAIVRAGPIIASRMR